MAYNLCKKYGLLSPVYEFSPRNGCWFCPNMSDCELRHLRNNHRELWNKLLELEKIPELDHLLNRYYEYYLYTNFMDICEDFNFSKHLLYGIVKTHLLWGFIALFAKNKKQITIEELAKIIAVYERRSPQMEGAVPFCGSFFN